MQKVLIIAATSAIAEATARQYAERGAALYLTARDQEQLARIKLDLATRGAAQVETAVLDVTDYHRYQQVFDQAWDTMESFDAVLLAHGVGTNERRAREENNYLRQQLEVNGVAMISLMNELGNRLAEQGTGTLAVISSVAGDRGRASNSTYGSAKAATSTYAEGLRQRLHPQGIKVLTIKPGWVDTPMTAHVDKNALFASPERVARGIVRAIDRGTSRDIYLPWFWRPILTLLRLTPSALWEKLKL